jgi:formylglycine-generating enzyme required for sulfatase activity
MSSESQPASNIFISYRRDDSAGHAGRLFDRLSAHFGDGQVFMDIDHIEPGEDFARAIEKAVGSCEILIALVGRSWLASRDETGRRIDNPNDFVRLEIVAALARDVRVIPLLVQGAKMPRPQDLPEDLRPLTRRNALEISDARWKYDVDQLIAALEKVLARQHGARSTAVPPAKASAITSARFSSIASARLSPTEADDDAARRGRRKRMLLTAALAFITVAVAAAVLIGVKSGWSIRPPEAGSANTSTENKNASSENSNASSENNNTSLSANRPVTPAGMVYVPGGGFTMGRDDGDAYERPAHSATVRPFFIDAHEVACEEYAKFIRATGRAAPPGWAHGSFPTGAERKPVTGVNWDDAVAFSVWAEKRLPTEEEWEFAARGNDGRRYPWGDDWREGLANVDAAQHGLADAGAFAGRSPFGAADMVGNAWEWTASGLAPYPGGQLPKQPLADLKVIRGGSYIDTRQETTTTYRRGYPPRGGFDYGNTGFRCAKDAAGTSGQD